MLPLANQGNTRSGAYTELDVALLAAFPARPNVDGVSAGSVEAKGSLRGRNPQVHLLCAQMLLGAGYGSAGSADMPLCYDLMLHRMMLRGQVDAVNNLLEMGVSGPRPSARTGQQFDVATADNVTTRATRTATASWTS